MTTTPNTPAELVALRDNPKDCYSTKWVNNAMAALHPSTGASAGDAQATIECLIERLKDWLASEIKSAEADGECSCWMQKCFRDLSMAETLIEDLPFAECLFESRYEDAK